MRIGPRSDDRHGERVGAPFMGARSTPRNQWREIHVASSASGDRIYAWGNASRFRASARYAPTAWGRNRALFPINA